MVGMVADDRLCDVVMLCYVDLYRQMLTSGQAELAGLGLGMFH